MLVIGTLPSEADHVVSRDKIEFTDVRWMEIRSVLRQEIEKRKHLADEKKRRVTQLEFKRDRLDMTSIHRWRAQALAEAC